MKRLIRFVLFLAAVAGALLLAQPADADAGLIGDFRTDPILPLDSRPTVLVVTGNWPCCSPPADHRVDVDLEARTIDVLIEGPGTGTAALRPYGLSIDLGVLPAGSYMLRATAYDVDAEMVLGSREGTLAVAEGQRILPLPAPPTDDRPVELTVQGVAPCPVVSLGGIDGDLVRLVLLQAPCSPAVPISYETSLLVPLDAGTYRVELRDPTFLDRLFSTLDLTVLPRPLELHGGRFTVSVAWADFEGRSGVGRPAELPTRDSTLYWFFSPTNEELTVKVLDGCGVNGHWWVLGAATTTVEYHVLVVDTESGAEWNFVNPSGQASDAFTDTEAFPCP